MPPVSVIIPSLNAPAIHRTVAALLAQRALDESAVASFEIVVVGRDDPGLIPDHPQVRFVDTGTPLPPAPARNRGAAVARGEILCFVDADCVPHPRWLGVLLARFADPAVAIVGGGVSFDDARYWTLADNLASFYDYLATLPPGTREQLPSLNLAVRRATWERLGGFCERYPFPAGEDAEWTTRARAAGLTLHFAPDATVEHQPSRASLRDLLRHAFRFGRYSIKLTDRYPDVAPPPAVLRRTWTIVLGAPALATGVTWKVMRASRWRYPRTLPAVWLAKLAWCAGAAVTRWRGDHPLTRPDG